MVDALVDLLAALMALKMAGWMAVLLEPTKVARKDDCLVGQTVEKSVVQMAEMMAA